MGLAAFGREVALQQDGHGVGKDVAIVERFFGQHAVAVQFGGGGDGEVVEVDPFAVVRDDELGVIGEVELRGRVSEIQSLWGDDWDS